VISRRKVIIGLAVVLVVSTIFGYTPILLYGAFSLGIKIADSEIDGIRVDMEKWWVPIVSPGSILQETLTGGNARQVIFVKAEGTFNQSNRRIAFSRPTARVLDAHLQNSGSIRFKWGEVRGMTVSSPSSKEHQHVYLAAHNLLITTTSLEALHEIRDIRPVTVKK
jgi:hypothetical protein